MLDVLIIGSGPAGLSAGVYAARANLDVMIAEKEYLGTGQIAESSRVDNYLGLPAINGYDLGEKFREHAENLGIPFYEGEAVHFEQLENGWRTHFDNGKTKDSRTIIYAAGAAHRTLGVLGENELMGRGVSFCAACDGAFYQGKSVAVIGGGDTALDDALYLSAICKDVSIIHRRDEFRGSAHTVDVLKSRENIHLVLGETVQSISGESHADGVVLNSGRTIEADGVFLAVGMLPRTEALKGVVELDKAGYIVADESGKTSARGFYAAGDVRTKALRQVVTAVSDGANAVNSAAEFIRLEA